MRLEARRRRPPARPLRIRCLPGYCNAERFHDRNWGIRTVQLVRFRLENWRNFRHVELDLKRRALFFGPNASGKSNLLDALRFLHDIVSVGGGFREAVERRNGVSKIRCLAARGSPDIVLALDVVSAAEGVTWTYELGFSQTRERAQITRERVACDGATILSRPDRDDLADAELLTQTHLEQVFLNKQFRGLAEYLASIRYLHFAPQLIREAHRYKGQVDDPYGWDLLDRIRRTRANSRKARLSRIASVLKVAIPQLRELEFLLDERGEPHLRGRYEHWRPRGAWQTEEQFSDGTLRLLGLLWSLLDARGLVLLEEPENSLHPDLVRRVPQMLARMQAKSQVQVFVTSHSSDILDDEGIGLDEVFLLEPGPEGTRVSSAGSIAEARILLEHGTPLSEVVIPRTRPRDALQLQLFD